MGVSSTRHSVKATVRRAAGYAPSNGHEIEILLGLTISANSNIGYEILFTVGAGSQIARQNGARGAFVIQGTGNWLDTINGTLFNNVLNGDVIEIQYAIIAGSPNIRALLNGVYQWDVNDTSASKIMSGQPGLGFFCRGGGAVAGVLDSYGWSGPITFASI